MCRAAFVSLAALLLLAAPPAAAGTVTIEFDFTATTISALGGALNIPPDGSIMAASAFVTAPAAGLTSISAGAVTLSGLTLDATLSAMIPFIGDFSGSVSASQISNAFGSLTASLMNAVVLPPAFLDVTGFVDCGGLINICDLLGTFPLFITGTQTLNDTFTLAVNNINVSGAATVMGTISLSLGGQTATIMLVGNEVARVLPEPGMALQIAGGVAGLLGLAWLHRRRR